MHIHMRLCRRSFADLLFEQVNPLENAFHDLFLPFVRLGVLFLQCLQHDLEIDIQLQRPLSGSAFRRRLLLLQQLKRHLAVQPGLPCTAAAHLVTEGK